MSTDDLWGSESEEADSHPELPPGMRAIQLSGVSPQRLGDIRDKYMKLASRPETLELAELVGAKYQELTEFGKQEAPDEVMGTFGLVAQTLGFHGETVKMAAKIETDDMLKNTLPVELLELIEKATELPVAITVLFEIAFSLGYALARDGSIAVSNE